MNKIIALFLATVFGINLLGPVVLFKIQQFEARRDAVKNIEMGIPDASLARIFITKENSKSLLWLGDDEFRYRGKMYDVVKAQRDHKGNTLYHCFDDSLEGFLYSRLSKHVKNSKKNQKNRTTTVKITFKYVSRKNSYSVVETDYRLSEQKHSFHNYPLFYNAPPLEISAPPPKLV